MSIAREEQRAIGVRLVEVAGDIQRVFNHCVGVWVLNDWEGIERCSPSRASGFGANLLAD